MVAGEIVAVDDFAGTGWGVACHWLGITEHGVDNMPEVIATRKMVGFNTFCHDVWEKLFTLGIVPAHWLYLASPPCQTFSVAGRGDGRRALDAVLQLCRDGVWRNPQALKDSAKILGDERTALVLTPLTHIYQHRPEVVILEQVPTVLPVWHAVANELVLLGYSVWVGLLQAEMYGVPQTRKRAILIARRDGKQAAPPTPTHSRYYSRDPKRLDPGVKKWVSMAEALGWGMTEKPYPTIATGAATAGGGTDPAALGGSGARRNVYEEREAGRWLPSGDADNDSPTGTLRLQAGDAAAIQSYPTGWGFIDRPAMTVHGHGLLTRGPSGQKQAIVEGLEAGTYIPRPPYTLESARKSGEQREDYTSLSDRYQPDAVNFSPDEAATLQSYPQWCFDRPSNTVVGSFRPDIIAAPGYRTAGGPSRQNAPDSVHVDQGQAGLLQSYPTPFPFQGSRTKQFLQIGNAVPPLMAEAIIRGVLEA